MSGISCRTREAASRALARAALRRRRCRSRSIPTARRPAPAMSAPCLRVAMSRCCSRRPTRRLAPSSISRWRAIAGVHLAAFAVADAGKSHRAAGRGGLSLRPLVKMQRPVDTETGPATAAFTVARVERGAMAEGRIQILTHRTEDAVWQTRWLAHPNGARALASVVIAVQMSTRRRRALRASPAVHATPTRSGQTVTLDRGRVELVTRARSKPRCRRSPSRACRSSGAYGIVVASLDAVETMLTRAGLRTRRAGDAWWRLSRRSSARAPGCLRREARHSLFD